MMSASNSIPTARSFTPKTYYVYTYAYPDGTIFYIGKGAEGRIDHHELEAGRSDCVCRRCRIIRDIWASGKPVQKRIVFETFDEIEAFTYEHDLIEQHMGPCLANIAGNPHRPSVDPQKPRERKAPLLAMNRESVEEELKKEIIGTRGASHLLQVSPNTAVRFAQQGKIRGFKVRDVWRFYRSDIEDYIKRQIERARQSPPPEQK